MRGQDQRFGVSQRIVMDTTNPQVAEGAPIRVKMQGEWIRGRFEYDQDQGMNQPVINAGDKKFIIPEGTEIELV